MGHSDEWTFADYFKYEKEIYRAIISAAVLCQWIAEHDTKIVFPATFYCSTFPLKEWT